MVLDRGTNVKIKSMCTFTISGKFFYQGDIRMTEKQKKQLEKLREQGLKRDVIHYASSKWTETPIPYYLDSSLGKCLIFLK